MTASASIAVSFMLIGLLTVARCRQLIGGAVQVQQEIGWMRTLLSHDVVDVLNEAVSAQHCKKQQLHQCWLPLMSQVIGITLHAVF